MIKLPFHVRCEQAVYGSFPFWHRGYAMLAHSAGCRTEWLTEFRTVCQRCGEPPARTIAAESLLAIRLKSGPWMIAGLFPLGRDDQDRPGALAFHALFLSRWVYHWIGSNPFLLCGSLRSDWTAADRDRTLPPLSSTLALWERPPASGPAVARDQRVAGIVKALIAGRRVVVQSNSPIKGLACDVWDALPRSVRRRARVATWVFDNANKFDLVGLPKLAGVSIAPSDLVFAFEHADQ